MMKVIVCHPAQQHSYRLATAMKKSEMLMSYCTTVYYKPKSLTSFVSKFLKAEFQKKAERRRCKDLEDCDVVQFCESLGLVTLLTANVRKLRSFRYMFRYRTADVFAKKVAKYAVKHNVDAVITYDDTSPLLFEILAKEAPHIKRILDVSAANLHYMRRIYDMDAVKMPRFANRLHTEYAKVWNDSIMERALREIKGAQYFLTPSEFVRKSLRFSGVRDEQMLNCPYGVDVSQFSCKQYDAVQLGRPLQFIYVGGVKELKGISYLLEAFLRIPRERAHLTVVGKYDPDDWDIQPYKECVSFVGMVLHSEIPELLKKSDVYVFASLGEGLSLSTLEAAACGLPLIVSENSGVNDNMKEGREGFSIPIQNTDAIVEKVLWYCEHQEQIEVMGRAAREMALKLTWDNYYRRVREEMEKV